MNFGISIEASPELGQKTFKIVAMGDKAKDFFASKSYGDGVKSLVIGFVCVAPEMDFFFPLTKPSYVKGKKTNNAFGLKGTIEDAVSYPVKFNIEELKDADDLQIQVIVASGIVESLIRLDVLKKKIPNFDLDRFKEDLRSFFRSEGLIN